MVLRKCERKNKFKFNKLFLYNSLNSFYLFYFIITKLNNLKVHIFLINFNYILFCTIELFSIVEPNMRKLFFIFFIFLIF